MVIRRLQANNRPDSRPLWQYRHLRLDIPHFRQESLRNILLKRIGGCYHWYVCFTVLSAFGGVFLEVAFGVALDEGTFFDADTDG